MNRRAFLGSLAGLAAAVVIPFKLLDWRDIKTLKKVTLEPEITGDAMRRWGVRARWISVEEAAELYPSATDHFWDENGDHVAICDAHRPKGQLRLFPPPAHKDDYIYYAEEL